MWKRIKDGLRKAINYMAAAAILLRYRYQIWLVKRPILHGGMAIVGTYVVFLGAAITGWLGPLTLPFMLGCVMFLFWTGDLFISAQEDLSNLAYAMYAMKEMRNRAEANNAAPESTVALNAEDYQWSN